jgi:hypothetical protein
MLLGRKLLNKFHAAVQMAGGTGYGMMKLMVRLYGAVLFVPLLYRIDEVVFLSLTWF